jgi:hypothetical protein
MEQWLKMIKLVLILLFGSLCKGLLFIFAESAWYGFLAATVTQTWPSAV